MDYNQLSTTYKASNYPLYMHVHIVCIYYPLHVMHIQFHKQFNSSFLLIIKLNDQIFLFVHILWGELPFTSPASACS